MVVISRLMCCSCLKVGCRPVPEPYLADICMCCRTGKMEPYFALPTSWTPPCKKAVAIVGILNFGCRFCSFIVTPQLGDGFPKKMPRGNTSLYECLEGACALAPPQKSPSPFGLPEDKQEQAGRTKFNDYLNISKLNFVYGGGAPAIFFTTTDGTKAPSLGWGGVGWDEMGWG